MLAATTLPVVMAWALIGQVDWFEPFPAHKAAGNVYYVGSKDLASYLITTPEGHILINSGFERTVPLIRDSVESLGFKMTDVKILLASHAHSDHVAGHALLRDMTGARVLVMKGDDGVIASGGEGQYFYGASRWKPCKVDRVLEDGDEVKLGGVVLVAHRTPGHTRGCTTWSWKVDDGGRTLDVVVIGSPNVNPGYRLVDNKDYPEIAADFARTFEVLKSLPCDVFLGAHGGYYGMTAKYERLKKGNGLNPFVDPEGYRSFVEQKEVAFRTTLREQTASAPRYTRTEDVIYGRKFGTALTMDVFRPRQNANGQGIIHVVSGGWFSAHEGVSPGFAAPFLDRGYTVFAVVHGSQPRFTIPEVLQDMNRAVRFIRHHAKDYGIDPDRLGICGGSAGGHLSLMQGTAGDLGDPNAKDPVDRESSRVRAVACFFPPTDFLNYGKPGEDALGRGILRDFAAPFDFHRLDPASRKFVPITDEDAIREIGRSVSPINHVSPDDPPTLIIHGDADKLVPIQQAEIIVEKLKEAGVEAKLVVKPGAVHGWAGMDKDIIAFADWFDEHLKGRGASKAEPRAIAAPDAKDHVGETRTVEATIRSTKDAAPHREYYLDSEEDFRSDKNIAIVISYDSADRFKAAAIENPADYYKGKTIRVTGTLIREENQVRIRVTDPDQIKVVEKGR
jgi:acetyl esterase/lipase